MVALQCFKDGVQYQIGQSEELWPEWQWDQLVNWLIWSMMSTVKDLVWLCSKINLYSLRKKSSDIQIFSTYQLVYSYRMKRNAKSTGNVITIWSVCHFLIRKASKARIINPNAKTTAINTPDAVRRDGPTNSAPETRVENEYERFFVCLFLLLFLFVFLFFWERSNKILCVSDIVNHTILWEKLRALGVGLVIWVSSYLSDRHQFVNVSNKLLFIYLFICLFIYLSIYYAWSVGL